MNVEVFCWFLTHPFYECFYLLMLLDTLPGIVVCHQLVIGEYRMYLTVAHNMHGNRWYLLPTLRLRYEVVVVHRGTGYHFTTA